MTWEGLRPPYRTIIADPPWDHSDKGPTSPLAGGGWGGVTGVPYETMSLAEIAALPVADLADGGAHLYLWTTSRYLRSAYDIVKTWGFTGAKPIVWCKPPIGPFMGGPYGGSSVEFCLYARRGNLPTIGRAGRQWFQWKRGAHSAKPPEFMDIVEQVSPGPYVELFARTARPGWDCWGDEAPKLQEAA